MSGFISSIQKKPFVDTQVGTKKERINMNSERILLCTFCQYTLLGNNYNNDNNNNEYHPSTTINEYKDVLFKI